MNNQRNEEVGSKTCCICGKEYTGYGNNPEPVRISGRCCNDCNEKRVIPARMLMLSAFTRRDDK